MGGGKPDPCSSISKDMNTFNKIAEMKYLMDEAGSAMTQSVRDQDDYLHIYNDSYGEADYDSAEELRIFDEIVKTHHKTKLPVTILHLVLDNFKRYECP